MVDEALGFNAGGPGAGLESKNRDRVAEQVEQWRDDLVNLTRQNKLLYFKHTKSSSLEIEQPSGVDVLRVLDGRPGLLEFYEPEDPARGAAGQTALPTAIPRTRKPAEALCHNWAGSAAAGALQPASRTDLFKILRNLDRQARAEFMDKGLQSLYLGLGLLEWVDPKAPDEKNLAPLILLPVELIRSGPGDPFRLQKAADDPIVNPAIQLKVEADFGVVLPQLEDDDLDLEAYLRSVRAVVAARVGWRVLDRVVIARFSFQKEVMYRDLLVNQQLICAHPLVRALADPQASSTEFDFDPPDDDALDRIAPETGMVSILDADATQRRCIWSAREGRTFVMDGPPGTGKSQTIANMIAELLASGKTVLFVSQKAAALEVVYSRLKRFGLDEYVLQLHSHKATRREVAKQLSDAVSRRPEADGALPDAELVDLQRSRTALNAYAAAMNERREPLGRPLTDVIGIVSAFTALPRPAVAVKIDASLTPSALAEMLDAADALSRAWGPIARGEKFLWRDLSTRSMDAAGRASLAKNLDDLKLTNRQLGRALRESEEALYGWPIAHSISGLRRVASLLDSLADAGDLEPSWLALDRTADLDTALDQLADGQTRRMDALGRLQAALGSEVSAARATELSAAVGRLLDGLKAPEGWAPRGDLDERALFELAERGTALLGALESEAPALVKALCRAVGLKNIADPTLEELADLSRLLHLAEEADKPEPEWLSSARIAELRRAEQVLTELVAEIRQRRDEVDSVFVEGVMALDAASMKARFAEVHVGFGKVRPAYFRDRKALASCARSGRFSTEAVGLLGSVAELQSLNLRIGGFERESGSLLGDYYAGAETDVQRLSHAVETAETALRIVGERVSLANALGVAARKFELDPVALIKVAALDRILAELGACLSALGLDALATGPRKLSATIALVRDVTAGVTAWAGAVSAVAELAEGRMQVSVAEVAVEAARSVVAVQSGVAEQADRLATLIGPAYAGLETAVKVVRDRVGRMRPVLTILGGPVSLAAAERVIAAKIDSDVMHSHLDQWDRHTRALLELFAEPRRAQLAAVLEGSPEDSGDLVDKLAATSEDIVEWFAYLDALDRFGEAGLGELSEACQTQCYRAADLHGIVHRVVLETWIDSVIKQDSKRLSPLRTDDRNALRGKYAQLDRRLVRSAAGRVMAACNARRPAKRIGGVSLILREGEKKKRHMPIRDLLSRAKADALSLKPCFMMSPLSVSQFLPPDFVFDVVLFDEASQIRPHDAINCIYRGMQHVIAGDQQQLPPTTFFDTSIDDGDDWSDDQLEVYESILDTAKSCASVPSLPLEWHYRSRHEDLITYSNVSFYDGRLVTFPSADVHSPTLGVGFNKVAGVYRRGAGSDNPVEAAKVAGLVAHYARNHPGLTLGVVAFSSAQEDAIQNAIDEMREKDASLSSAYFAGDRLDGFFVKNLETVQGDERDVIILSVGYGPDATGKVYANFGPINLAGGYRRLNVAVTRARMRLELVTSISASDISGTSESEGARHLRRYLDYAENGPSVLVPNHDSSLGDVESPFEDEVARTIRSWGYDVTTQVGCANYRIDLGVVHPDQPGRHCLAVECDGAMYHSSRVARDRDRLRDAVMIGLGWRIHRIWGPSWYRERTATEASLRSAIEAAVKACGEPDQDSPGEEPEAPATVVISEVEVSETFYDESWVADYVISKPHLTAMDLSVPMGDRSASRVMLRVIPEIVACEQPVCRDLVLDRLKFAWHVGRAGSKIQAEFDTAMRSLIHGSVVYEDGDGFLWTGAIRTVRHARRPGLDDRSWRTCSQISPKEYDFAVAKILEGVASIGEHQLEKMVAEIFGWERLGADISRAIGASRARVVAAGATGCEIISDAGLKASPSTRRPSPLQGVPTTPKSALGGLVLGNSGARHAPGPSPHAAEDVCVVCGSRFGEHSKPTELKYFDPAGTRTATVHATCYDQVSRGRRVRGYRWEAVREGLVPIRATDPGQAVVRSGHARANVFEPRETDVEHLRNLERQNEAKLEENKKKYGGLYDSSPFD